MFKALHSQPGSIRRKSEWQLLLHLLSRHCCHHPDDTHSFGDSSFCASPLLMNLSFATSSLVENFDEEGCFLLYNQSQIKGAVVCSTFTCKLRKFCLSYNERVVPPVREISGPREVIL